MLLCGESIRRTGPPDSFVVSRTLPGVESLLDFLLDRCPPCPRGDRRGVRSRLADALGACLARIHQAGVRHDDLHPGNLLVRDPLGEPELFLIDLPYARVGRPLGWAAVARQPRHARPLVRAALQRERPPPGLAGLLRRRAPTCASTNTTWPTTWPG